MTDTNSPSPLPNSSASSGPVSGISQAALLPEGLRDMLPPHAQAEATLLQRLVDAILAHGYERVAPPLVEFEDSLFGPHIDGAPRDLFRMMDPVSQRMLAVRADMTTQVARIAIDRLGHYARPLRLTYAGPVLRVQGSQLRADRQFAQVGAELVGQDDVAACAEIIAVAVQAARAAQLDGLTLDLTMPDLVTVMAGQAGCDAPETHAIRAALDGKDAARLAQVAGRHASLFAPLLDIAGPADDALALLQALQSNGPVAQRITRMAALVSLVRQRLPGQAITLDPTEHHGFQYQTWVGFSLFARGVRGEVGRGGSYEIARSAQQREPAVGFSIYLNGLVDAGAGVEPSRRVYISTDVPDDVAAGLRRAGWITVRALDGTSTAAAQRCSHIYTDGAVHAVDPLRS